MPVYFADYAWLPHGWAANVRLEAKGGVLGSAQADAVRAGAERVGRYVLPGMPNLHSHAFQRAMAGLTERHSGARAHPGAREETLDSFWTWREVMYAFASCIGPDELRAIAAQLYVEMLKAGYTQVCEFHYLHHQPDGKPYADPAAMSLALIEAAREAGIGLTLLPTLYMAGGFDGRPLSERQRRFGHDVDAYLRLLERLRSLESPVLRVGVALHSLRAVPEGAMRTVLASDLTRDCPIHIHIAEQIGEVQDCLAIRNARPVEWLLDHAPVEELRWLEYGQRLLSRRRNIGASRESPSTGENLFRRTLLGGAAASGVKVGALTDGAAAARADMLVLDDASPLLAGRDAAHALDTWIFAGNANLVRDVVVAGEVVVRDFRHRDEERIVVRYRGVVERLARGG